MTLKQSFNKKLQENFRENVNLSNYSWFNLGGKAEYFFKAEDKKQLIYFLKEIKSHNLRTTIVGAGSNILVQGQWIKELLCSQEKFFNTKIIGKNIIEAGGATLDKKQRILPKIIIWVIQSFYLVFRVLLEAELL